jgi:hypothetical protein
MTIACNEDGIDESLEDLSDRRIQLLKQLEEITDSESSASDEEVSDGVEPSDTVNQLTVVKMESDVPDESAEPHRPSVMDRLGAKVSSSVQESGSSPQKQRTNLSFWCDDRLEQPMDFGGMHTCKSEEEHKTQDLRCVIQFLKANESGKQEELMETERKIVVKSEEQHYVDHSLEGGIDQYSAIQTGSRKIIKTGHVLSVHGMAKVGGITDQYTIDNSSTQDFSSRNVTSANSINQSINSVGRSVGTSTESAGKSTESVGKSIEFVGKSTESVNKSTDMSNLKMISSKKPGKPTSPIISEERFKSLPMEISSSLDSSFVKNTSSVGSKFFEVSLDSACKICINTEEENQANQYCQELILKHLSLTNAITEKKTFLDEMCQKMARDQYDAMQVALYGMELDAEYLQMLIFLVKSSGLMLVVGLPYPVSILAQGDYAWLKRWKLHDEVVHVLPPLEDAVLLCTSRTALSEENVVNKGNGYI